MTRNITLILLCAVLLCFSRTALSQTEGERHEHTRIDDYIQYAPMAAGLGLGWLGVEARHSGRDRVLLTGTAFCTMTAIAGGLKYTIREERPDKTDNRSFPSGHAARAFMGAELVRMEYGTPLGIAAYGTAIGVACLRVYNDRHWWHDVAAGAGIGILSTHIAYWVLPLEKRILGWDNEQAAVILPTYQPDTKTVGLSLSYSF
jgi:membrane-associated phospholipid phosphatase